MDFNKLVNGWISESQMEENRNDYIATLEEEREEKESNRAGELLSIDHIKRRAFFIIKEDLRKGGLI